MKNIAIIPARSGSKGLPNKNIRLLNGVPLIAYTIHAALDSGMFDVVMVSTDSEEYANIAKEWGAEVPFLRSSQTSADQSSSWSVVEEVLSRYAEMGKTFDTFALLQATSPLRTGKHIVEAYEVLKNKNAHASISICELPKPKDNFHYVEEDLCMDSWYDPDPTYKPRQFFKKAYDCNGAIYISRTDTFAQQASIFQKKCYGYMMDKVVSFDVDSLEDFMIAEALINYLPEYRHYFDR